MPKSDVLVVLTVTRSALDQTIGVGAGVGVGTGVGVGSGTGVIVSSAVGKIDAVFTGNKDEVGLVEGEDPTAADLAEASLDGLPVADPTRLKTKRLPMTIAAFPLRERLVQMPGARRLGRRGVVRRDTS